MARHKQCQQLGGSHNADLTAQQWTPSWTVWHIFPQFHLFTFSHPGNGISFVTLTHRMLTDETMASLCLLKVFFYPFAHSF